MKALLFRRLLMDVESLVPFALQRLHSYSRLQAGTKIFIATICYKAHIQTARGHLSDARTFKT